MLSARTPEGHSHCYLTMKCFIFNSSDYKHLLPWLDWWNERKTLFARAFYNSNTPSSNQAEVIHVGWVHRDTMGMSLLDSVYVDLRDCLLLVKKLQGMESGTYRGGSGPSIQRLQKRRSEREIEHATRLGEDILSCGIDVTTKCNHKRLYQVLVVTTIKRIYEC